jgi:tetratricopeptide (TPR) repeat protein
MRRSDLQPVQRDPDLITRGRERFAVRDFHGAVLLLREAVLEGYAYPDVYNLLALCLALVERPLEALAAFDRAIALNPRYVEAHLNRAVLLSALGRDDEAQESFDSAHRLGGPDESGFPVVVANRLANAHASLGAHYRDAGALDEAIAQYARALELRPGFPDIRLAHARALLERGRLPEAAASLDALLAANPRSLDALLLRGLSAYLQEDLETAGVFWTRAAEAHPAEPRIGIYLSMLARRRMARS